MSNKKDLDPVELQTCELVSTERSDTDDSGQIDKIQLEDYAVRPSDNSALDLQLNVGDLALKLNCQYTAQDIALGAQIQLLEKELAQCRLQLQESQQIIGFLQGRILSQQEQIVQLERGFNTK